MNPFKLARDLLNLPTGRIFQPILVKVQLEDGTCIWGSISSINEEYARMGGSDFTFLVCNEVKDF